MLRACIFCKVVFDGEGDHDKVSHGICPACRDMSRADMDLLATLWNDYVAVINLARQSAKNKKGEVWQRSRQA